MAIQSHIFQARIWEFHPHDIGDAVFGPFDHTGLKRCKQLRPWNRCRRGPQRFHQFLGKICNNGADFQASHVIWVLNAAFCIGKVAPSAGIPDCHQTDFIA